MRALTLLALSFVPAVAAAVPMELTHTGRMFETTGLPVDGQHDVAVALYTSPTSGTSLWSETIVNADFDNGYFAVELGSDSSNPLSSGLFDNASLWVGIALDGGPEVGDRLAVRSVPFARRAETAVNLEGGTVDATEISVNGSVVIDGSGSLAAGGTLGGLTGCGPDDVATYDGSNWSCGPASADWSDLSGVPPELEDGVDDDTLAALTCADGEVTVWNAAASAWRCGAPYTDGDAVVAMGPLLDGNPLHHDRYTDGEAIAAVGPHTTPYTDADAVLAVGPHYSDADAIAAVGPHTPAYTDAEAIAAVGPHYSDADAVLAVGPHYTDANAIAAVGPHYTDAQAVAAVGPHYGDADAVAAVGPHYADADAIAAVGPHNSYSGSDFATSGQTCPAGQQAEGVDASGNLVCGTAGANVLGRRIWNTQTNIPCCGSWHTIQGSSFSATTTGRPILTNTNLSMTGGSTSTCRITVDGVNAGTFSSQPNYGDPYWTEGLLYTGGTGWQQWNQSKVWTGIPAGAHTFAIQCANDSGTSRVSNGSSVGSSWNVIEL